MPKKQPPGLNDFPGIVLIDQREKLPYTFADIPADADEGGGILNIKTAKMHLPTGDISIFGHERDGITLERKSKNDLWRTISNERARFERELQRMQCFRRAFVMVECELSELLEPPTWTKPTGEVVKSQYSPKALHRSILAWEQRYPNVHWKLLPGRRASEVVSIRVLDRYLTEFAMDYGENK
jgi:ERCC4-type nuclease